MSPLILRTIKITSTLYMSSSNPKNIKKDKKKMKEIWEFS